MDTILIILAGLFLLIGLVGCVLPILPGIVFSYLGLIILQITDKVQFTSTFLISWGVAVLLIQILDYYVPIWSTKKFGGSRLGVLGTTLGLIVGIFFGPFGIIFGPFVGALIGELVGGNQLNIAFKSAFGAFVGFIIGTVFKLVVAVLMIYYFVEAII